MFNGGPLNTWLFNGDGERTEDPAALRITRGPVAGLAAGWQDGQALAPNAAAGWDAAPAASFGTGFPWDQGEQQAAGAGFPFAALPPAATGAALAWDEGEQQAAGAGFPFAALPPAATGAALAWDEGGRIAAGAGFPFAALPPAATGAAIPWGPGRPMAAAVVIVHGAARLRGQAEKIPWGTGRRPLWWVYRPPPGDSEDPDPDTNPFYPGLGWAIPIRRVYFVIHDIEVVRLPGREQIPAHSLQISLDADSREWSFSANLLGPDAIDAVRPDANGPAILEASINGNTWQFVIDEWSQSLQFGKRGASVRGRSLSAELGAPWYLPASGASATLETAQSLAAGFLPNGWALTWPAVDWPVPAGAWSYRDLVPIQAIQAIAEAGGAIVVPAKAGRALKVQARYPVAPWSFAETTPDLIIPAAAITGLQFGSTVANQGNAVFVHGGPVGGVLARILRTGTAGDRTLPTVADDLITDTDAALARGIRELARHHEQPEVRSFTMPLGGAYPLCEVGYLVRVESGAVHRGVVNAVSVEVAQSGQGVTVRQTVTLGEKTPNLWSQFSALVPSDPLLIGEVQGPAGSGAVTVQLVNGGTLTAKGEAAIGAMVYVRAGRIEGPAPDLPGYEFET